MTKYVVGLLGLVLVLGIGYWIFTNSSKTTNPTVTPAGTNSAQTTPVISVTIVFNGSTFSPKTATVHSGDVVAFRNDSSSAIQINSNPHPLHTDDLDLNIGTVNPGETQTATLTKTGTFGYHNHLNPGQSGTITIQ